MVRRGLQLDDYWKIEYSSSCEDKARHEMAWYSRYAPAREHLLVALIPSVKSDELNDVIPF